jgi:Na+/proline symporter
VSVVDWVVLCAALGLVVVYGLWRSRGRGGLDHYLLAGRSMPWYGVAIGLVITALDRREFTMSAR